MRRAALLLTLLALVAAGCGGGEEASPLPETVEGTLPEETAETGPTNSLEGDPEAGSQIFASSGCGGCHTLEAAGSGGNVGPNLDQSQPSLELTLDRVTNGQGAMPAYKDQLSEQEIADVASYVVASTS